LQVLPKGVKVRIVDGVIVAVQGNDPTTKEISAARKVAQRAESTKRLNKAVDSFVSEATASKSMPVAPRGCPGQPEEVPDDLYAET